MKSAREIAKGIFLSGGFVRDIAETIQAAREDGARWWRDNHAPPEPKFLQGLQAPLNPADIRKVAP